MKCEKRERKESLKFPHCVVDFVVCVVCCVVRRSLSSACNDPRDWDIHRLSHVQRGNLVYDPSSKLIGLANALSLVCEFPNFLKAHSQTLNGQITTDTNSHWLHSLTHLPISLLARARFTSTLFAALRSNKNIYFNFTHVRLIFRLGMPFSLLWKLEEIFAFHRRLLRRSVDARLCDIWAASGMLLRSTTEFGGTLTWIRCEEILAQRPSWLYHFRRIVCSRFHGVLYFLSKLCILFVFFIKLKFFE